MNDEEYVELERLYSKTHDLSLFPQIRKERNRRRELYLKSPECPKKFREYWNVITL
jgi:hypothetical protein